MTPWTYPTLWKLTAGEIRRRPGRTLLTLAGIVIGVAAIVAITVTIQATRRAYQDMFAEVTGRASLEVVAEGAGGFDPNAVAGLESLAGVKAVVPVLQAPVALLGPAGPVPALALGVDPARDAAARDYLLREGRLLEGGGEGILLEAGFAKTQGLGVGRSARLLTSTGFASLPIVGLLEPRGAATFNGGAVIFLPLARAQRLFALRDQINSAQLVLTDGANPLQVEAAVRRLLPAGLTVQTPGAFGELSRAALLSTEQGLAALSVVSLVAGAFVILNAFLMNLGERRRQLAILRALGATRAQVTRWLVRETALLGLLGTVVGCALGWALALALVRIMGELMGVTLPALRWTLSPFLLALLLGPGMAVAATILPARRAGRRAPLGELFPQRASRDEGVRRWPGYLGLALLAAVSVLEIGFLREWFPVALSPSLLPLAMALLLVGSVLAVQLVLVPLTRLAALPLKPVLGLEGRLAFRHLERHRARTVLTVGVLVIALMVAISVGHSLLNGIRDIRDWGERIGSLTDFFIRGTMPDTTTTVTAVALPEALGAEIAALAGVERVDKFGWILARAGDRRVVIMALTLPPDRPLPLPLVTGDPPAVLQGFLQGEVILGATLAQRLGLGVGQEIGLETRHGPKALRIAGTANEYTVGGMCLYLEWGAARRLFDLAGVHTFLVTARKGTAADVAARVQAFCDERGLLFQSNADLRNWFDQKIAGTVAFCWGLMVLVFIVASLGIVNTLTMNVLEQTRELGVLRAIGLKRGQVGKLVLSQALAVGVISLLPGVLLGLVAAYLQNLVTYPLQGHPVPFQINLPFLSGCCIVALACTVLAAFLPARRAARLQVIRALQYE